MKRKNYSKIFLNVILYNFINSKNYFYSDNKVRCTYKSAYLKISKIVEYLKTKKIEKIIVLSDKSINYYLIVISIIFTGKTWIQVSPNIPLDRIKKIIKISNCKFGFYDESFRKPEIKEKLNIKFLEIKKILQNTKYVKMKSVKEFNENNTAMIFFTSGSTSIPKGVMISYKSFTYSASQQIKNLGYRKGKETFADYHDNSFVMSLNVIFPALFLDSTISPLTQQLDKYRPIDHLKKNKITVLITVPSFFLYINNFIRKNLKINKIIFCGENFSLNVFRIVIEKLKFNSLYNCYGATELSPWAFFYKYSKKHDSIIKKYNQVPIGKCFSGLKTYLNNNQELCISGPTLSKGYLNIEQNKFSFFLRNNKRFYNTGDIAEKYKKLFFIMGRNDKQIKLKGYRINLLEIENHSKNIKGIEFAMCFKKSSEEKLLLFVVSKKKGIKKKISSYLSKNVPNYMIPSEIFISKKIILNKNGKVDRKYYLKKFNE